MLIAAGMLLWEAWLFPSFGQRIFGGATAKSPPARLVVDTISTDFGSARLRDAREKLNELRLQHTEQHPLVLEQAAVVQRLEASAPPGQFGGAGSAEWRFKSLVPPNHLARVLFVRWTDGTPKIEPYFSAYFKTGQKPADVHYTISCHPEGGTSNLLQWNVNLDLGFTAGAPVAAPPSYRLLDMPARMSVASGRQQIIRLLDEAEPAARGDRVWNRVELRVMLEPLGSPAVRALPFEKEYGDYIAGSGFDLPLKEIERLLRQLPIDQ